MAEFDDGICSEQQPGNVVRIPAVRRRDGDPNVPSDLRERPLGFVDVLPEGDRSSFLHDEDYSQFWDYRQPILGENVIFPIFGKISPKGDTVKKERGPASDVIFKALTKASKERSQADIAREAGISTSTVGRWTTPPKDKPHGLQRDTFDALCRIDDVRGALADHLTDQPKSNQAAWQAIAADLSALLKEPSVGWTLVRRLRRMEDLGILEPDFEVLSGAIKGREKGIDEASARRSIPGRKPKKKSS